MPPPAPVAFDELLSGRMDSAWVQTEGIVQSVETHRPTLEDAVSLQWGDHRYWRSSTIRAPAPAAAG
jgi:hypothetical protein